VRVALGPEGTAISDTIEVEIPAGRSQRTIEIATAELAPGAYHLRAELRAGGDQIATLETKAYVTPQEPPPPRQ
jgi:hypothetical protein